MHTVIINELLARQLPWYSGDGIGLGSVNVVSAVYCNWDPQTSQTHLSYAETVTKHFIFIISSEKMKYVKWENIISYPGEVYWDIFLLCKLPQDSYNTYSYMVDAFPLIEMIHPLSALHKIICSTARDCHWFVIFFIIATENSPYWSCTIVL